MSVRLIDDVTTGDGRRLVRFRVGKRTADLTLAHNPHSFGFNQAGWEVEYDYTGPRRYRTEADATASFERTKQALTTGRTWA